MYSKHVYCQWIWADLCPAIVWEHIREMSSHATSQGKLVHRLPQFAEPLRTDPLRRRVELMCASVARYMMSKSSERRVVTYTDLLKGP